MIALDEKNNDKRKPNESNPFRGLLIKSLRKLIRYVNNFGNYNELYGSIGTVLILMLLIYFNSLVLLIGFELNVSLSSLKKIADERMNNLADGKENPV